MLRSGFSGITVSIDLKCKLANVAETGGFAPIPALIDRLLSDTIPCTGTREPPPFRSAKKGAKMGCFSKAG